MARHPDDAALSMGMRKRICTSDVWRVAALAAAIGAGVFGLGCNNTVIEPKVASSSAQPGYAESFPNAVSATIAAFGGDASESDKLAQGFAAYPDALSGDGVDEEAVA